MKKHLFSIALVCCLAFAGPVWALNFGVVDASKVFSKFSETQKTKSLLEGEKGKMQNQLDSKKKEVADADAKYLELAKKIQGLRDAKKDVDAKALESQLKAQREVLANANSELQKFFEESQRRLYELEDEKMGSLSKVLDEKVDTVIRKIAAAKGLEAVFEKRMVYYPGGEEGKKLDITEDVIAALNAAGVGATPAPAVPVKKGK